MIYIGAEEVISPLGKTIEQNFSAIVDNQSGISLVHDVGFSGDAIYLSKMLSLNVVDKFEALISEMLTSLIKKIEDGIITSGRTIVIISSTKGELESNFTNPFGETISRLVVRFNLANSPVVVSNACISGVLAINAGSNFITSGRYDHALIIGCDLISDFVLYGFQSLFAVSDQPCRPFDSSRNGITLGEGCAGVILSNSESIFRDNPLNLLAGTSANDANHISGPSRTGEGLYRSIRKTLDKHNINASDIDFVSAHGTGTIYNDEMESIAFDRVNLTDKPINSLKGYFGHTLGAAGVMETAISMQMMRNGLLIKSKGFQEPGTSNGLNIISKNTRAPLNTILKTASGFGGGNASLIIKKL